MLAMRRNTRGGDVPTNPYYQSKASQTTKTARDNTYFLFPDLTQFVDSDFYADNQHLITKYPPAKTYFNAVPPYQPYRIVVIAMSSMQANGYHTVYSIDASKSTYDDICQELVDIGGINQQDYGKDIQTQVKSDAIKRIADDKTVHDTGYSTGYSQGLANAPKPTSALDGFLSGFNSVLGLAKAIIP